MKYFPSRIGGVQCIPENGREGLKGSEHYTLEALNAYFSHRCGYVLNESKHKVLLWMLANGWQGKPRYLNSTPARFCKARETLSDGFPYSHVKKLSIQ